MMFELFMGCLSSRDIIGEEEFFKLHNEGTLKLVYVYTYVFRIIILAFADFEASFTFQVPILQYID